MSSVWTQATCIELSASRHADDLGTAHIRNLFAMQALRKQSWRRWWIGFLALCVCSSIYGIDRDRRLDQLYHTRWAFSDGAPAEIFAITQTTDGYLWLGTTSGLIRFDGVHFKKYGPELGLPLTGRYVSSLLAVADGGLWIGFGSGDATFLKDGKVRNYSEQDGLPSKSIRAMVIDGHGVIWAAALGGVARFDGSNWKRIGADWNFSGPATAALADKRGTLWIGTEDGLFSLSEGAKGFQKEPGFSGYITKLTQGPDGSVCVALLGGSAGFGHQVRKSIRVLQPNLRMSSLDILADDQGSVWVTTMGDGLQRLSYSDRIGRLATTGGKTDIETFTQKDGLSSDYIESIFEDREGNVWVGTNAGLDRFRQSSVVPVQFPPGRTYFSLTVGDNGTIWASAQNNNTSEIEDGKLVVRPKSFASQLPSLSCTYRDPKGVLWANTGYSLSRIESGKIVKIDYPDHPRATSDGFGSGIAMTEDPSGRLWVSIKGKGIYRLENGSWTSFESLGGPPGFALSAYTDSLGRMWFGYLDKRVVMVDGTKIHIFSSKDAAQVGKVRSIQGRGSHVWIAGDDGVAFYDGTGFRQLLPADGVNFRDVFGIVETAGTGLWFSENRGIIHITADEIRAFVVDPDHRASYQLFDLLDGLPAQLQKSTINPSMIEGIDGRLWFATTQGVVWIDPKHISRNTQIPPVSIESVTANGVTSSPSSSMKLPARTDSLRIGYTALSLSVPERIRFKYKLEGQHGDWQDVGSRREAIYTNLGPGSYIFHVIACNNDGVWNARGAVLTFVIEPAFYQTAWFRLLYVAAAAGVLWLLYLARITQVTNQIQERLGARLEERERIARELHDTLLQGFQGLMLRFQAVLKTLPAHEPAHQMIEKALDRADEVLLEGRQRVRDLREEGNTGNELSDSLSECGKEMAQDSTVLFSVAVVGTAQALDPTVRNEAYRIGREALANAFQHARASKIEVELTYAHANLRLVIRDDGVGIEQEIASGGRIGHWGLSGMRERAQQIGAHLSMWSLPGAGTELDLSIPGRLAYLRVTKSSRGSWIKRAFRRLKEG
jgi:signal transduction histidine kinase/ligand-binding sensor domain-containing protein